MSMLELLLETFQTGSGFWNPIAWIIVAVLALLITFILRGFGNKKYKKGTEQVKSFLSGNPEYEKEQMHIKGSNVYWGFTESLKWIYKILEKIHTGNISDYILWFVIIMGVLFLLVGVF